jgi:hypothetical protein
MRESSLSGRKKGRSGRKRRRFDRSVAGACYLESLVSDLFDRIVYDTLAGFDRTVLFKTSKKMREKMSADFRRLEISEPSTRGHVTWLAIAANAGYKSLFLWQLPRSRQEIRDFRPEEIRYCDAALNVAARGWLDVLKMMVEGDSRIIPVPKFEVCYVALKHDRLEVLKYAYNRWFRPSVQGWTDPNWRCWKGLLGTVERLGRNDIAAWLEPKLGYNRNGNLPGPCRVHY